MYGHLIAAIRNLYSQMPIYIYNDEVNLKTHHLNNQLTPFDKLKEVEQNHINKIIKSWKKTRSNKEYMKKIAEIYMFYEYLKNLKEKKRYDLIKEVDIHLKHIEKEDIDEYIKEYGKKKLYFSFIKNTLHIILIERKNGHLKIELHIILIEIKKLYIKMM